MNEIDQDIRRKNLGRVISQYASVAAFARKHNVDATYMRQLLSKHRPFGEKAASKLEGAIGLPKGWLSVDEDEQLVLEIASYIRRLPLDKRAQMLGFARGLLVEDNQALPLLPTRNGLINIPDKDPEVIAARNQQLDLRMIDAEDMAKKKYERRNETQDNPANVNKE